MTQYRRHASGRAWEAAAADFLAARGLDVVARGYRCRLGELDLVCLDNGTLVVVEVRARASAGHGSAVESIDARKRRKIVSATRHYLMRNPAWFERPIRFDVVAVDDIESAAPKIDWIKAAFDAG